LISDDKMTKYIRIDEQYHKLKLEIWKQMDNLGEFGNIEPRIIIECIESQVGRIILNYSPTTEFSEELS